MRINPSIYTCLMIPLTNDEQMANIRSIIGNARIGFRSVAAGETAVFSDFTSGIIVGNRNSSDQGNNVFAYRLSNLGSYRYWALHSVDYLGITYSSSGLSIKNNATSYTSIMAIYYTES